MKSFKSHLGVIFPLVILLFSIEFSFMVDKIVSNYETTMGNDYNIIIVSENEISSDIIKQNIETFKELIPLDTKSVLDRLKNDVSTRNLSVLSNSLPKFYSLKLNSFPSSEYMSKIQSRLLKINGIKKVETFSKTYDKVYKMLVLSKSIFEYFAVLIALMGVALIFKQMKIWLYEHKRRVEIMTLFGAPYWLKSAMLYKLAIIDSIIATSLVTLFYAFVPALDIFQNAVFSIGFELPNLDLFSDTMLLFSASIVVSIIAVSLVMLQSREPK
ncbi:hypothetical protein [Campylobacter fetus]|uniref:Cell division protein FtsX n=1 Tax=Campylobacter fetus subsp. testudinum TaxID=1507806 RepID=A0AAX0HED4_CAMFE|nr:hypothetical protein [Campylobacter fetus]AGZ82046.1 cell division protein FtsX [Campylobacter fetus subsp. testudinum 03-427]AJB45780.1 cell division protein FtsX [Campylobacter fetus subsp. testudinum]ALV65212.1 cell division protein FtsX [Campylobacter fetus subsp. testudinum Sp3]OCR84998.1 cell division protein FtsX [Campylobacter fetus subsp. testudinum]OCR86845.1 cell division protein FtsX [Campylobacter fetus subsp. testudinum]